MLAARPSVWNDVFLLQLVGIAGQRHMLYDPCALRSPRLEKPDRVEPPVVHRILVLRQPQLRRSRLDGCDGKVAWPQNLLVVAARTLCCVAGGHANPVGRLAWTPVHDASEAAVRSHLF